MQRRIRLTQQGISLGLLFMLALCSQGTAAQVKKSKTKKVTYEMTVVELDTPAKGRAFYQVSFQQSQRHYKLLAKDAPRYIRLLRSSEKTHKPVLIERSREESDTIIAVKKIIRR